MVVALGSKSEGIIYFSLTLVPVIVWRTVFYEMILRKSKGLIFHLLLNFNLCIGILIPLVTEGR